jgi:hypothetical protein
LNWLLLRPHGASLIGPHECSVPGAKQEFGIHECTQQCVARCPIKAPEPLRLRRRQSQSRHFDVFTLNASEDVVKRLR